MRNIFILFLGVVLLLCTGVYLIEWVYTEVSMQRLLAQDSKLIDIDRYNTETQVRVAILEKIPIGSSEDEIKQFYFANREQGPWKNRDWSPKQISDSYGVVLRIWTRNRGHFLGRMVSGKTIIFLHIDPVNHRLVDVSVTGVGFEL